MREADSRAVPTAGSALPPQCFALQLLCARRAVMSYAAKNGVARRTRPLREVSPQTAPYAMNRDGSSEQSTVTQEGNAVYPEPTSSVCVVHRQVA